MSERNNRNSVVYSALDKHLFAVAITADISLTRSDIGVAIQLADHLNLVTMRCDPSLKRIARELSISERSVRNALRRLESEGWIKTYRNAGAGKTNRYLPNFERARASTGRPPSRQPATEKEEKRSMPNRQPAAPKPYNNSTMKIASRTAQVHSADPQRARLHRAEQDLVREFETDSAGYAFLMEFGDAEVQAALSEIASGRLRPHQAVARLARSRQTEG